MNTARLVAAIALATSTVAVVALAACNSFDDAPTTPANDGGAGDAGPANEGGGGSDASAGDGGAPDADAATTPCSGFRICDRFEDPALYKSPWQGDPETETLSSANLSHVVENGNGLLRVTVPPSDQNLAAFLRHDLEPLAKTEITFGLTLKLTGFGATDYVEIATLYLQDTAGEGIAFTNGNLKLYYASGSTAIIAGDPYARRRIFVTVSATKMTARDDDGKVIGELLVGSNQATGIVNGLRFGTGLYFSTPSEPDGGASVGGIIEIDDVVLDY